MVCCQTTTCCASDCADGGSGGRAGGRGDGRACSRSDWGLWGRADGRAGFCVDNPHFRAAAAHTRGQQQHVVEAQIALHPVIGLAVPEAGFTYKLALITGRYLYQAAGRISFPGNGLNGRRVLNQHVAFNGQAVRGKARPSGNAPHAQAVAGGVLRGAPLVPLP